MDKKILILLAVIVSLITIISATYNFRTIYNPFTGKLDYHITSNMSGENVTADYFIGDGSLLTSIEAGNLSWNQTLANTLYIGVGDEGNLNVNSSTWWATISGFISKWFYKSGNDLSLNETQLNISIDDRTGSNGSIEWIKPEHIFDVDDADIETDLNTYWDIAGDSDTGSYIFNFSNSNLTMDYYFGDGSQLTGVTTALTNVAFVNQTNRFIENQNFSQNISINSGNKFCLDADCLRFICYNGSSILISNNESGITC